MKKSQLRKIIRESIKELMTEQVTCPTGTKRLRMTPCPGSTFPNGNPMTGNWYTGGCATIDGQEPNPSHIGTIINNLSSSNVVQYELVQILPDSGNSANPTQDFVTTTCSGGPAPCTVYGCTDSTASNYDPAAIYDDGSCILSNAGCPTCDSSAWGNHQNWITQFTSMPHFSSSNPNQPCNMICNKIQIWDNNCQNAGPVQANQLACKIEEAQNQSQIHGCNC